ncbi:Eco57I restriction-modification methylase domain-containing protein [Salinilacihabitans rarus]|uniref:Eco57I restriction-modification methylase domain-containing protein n=1 Tax=Salinilacihabitans rarus TaxID=2961596 RepID=UPI0020C89974|nr:N-6 DNA methylase [Salinilacihabitans rarus]
MTIQRDRFRRVTYHTYAAVDREPEISVTGIAATSPLAQSQSEPPRSDSVSTGLRNESAYTDDLVKRLETTAADLESRIADPSPEMQAAVESWCGLNGYVPSDDATPSIIANQAVFGLLLKATLHEWYHRRGDLPEFEGNAHEQFKIAYEETGDSAFTACALDEILWGVEANTVAVTEARTQLLDSTQPATDIGRLYETLVAREHRRVLGQHRTPTELAELMRTWAISSEDTVLDPGMGAGQLSAPFHPDWEISTDPTRVYGVDRSPLAALMGGVAQAISGQQHETRRTDFSELDPADLTQDVDAVLCNPPYTRHESLPSAYKDKLNEQAENQTGLEIPETSPLYAYFYYHLGQFLDTGDRAAVLTPHHFLSRGFGEPLKQFLLREFDIKALLLDNPENESKFDTAQTTSMVVLLKAIDNEADVGVTRFIRVDRDPGVQTKLEAARDGNSGKTDWGVINCIEQSELSPEGRWDNLFYPNAVELPDLPPLSDIADVHRGLQTGENDFFCLSPDQVDDWGIDPQYLSRIVPSRRYVDGYDIRSDDWDDYDRHGRPTWLLYHLDQITGVPETTYDDDTGCAHWTEDSLTTDAATPIIEYLRYGLTGHESLSTRSTVHGRNPWYRVERGDTAPILVTSTGRSGFRAIHNETDAKHLNRYYGVYPDPEITQQGQKALLAYLNFVFGDIGISQQRRGLVDGLPKVEPGDVKDIPTIDPRELPSSVVATLAGCFDDLCEAARNDRDEAPTMDRIESVLHRLL